MTPEDIFQPTLGGDIDDACWSGNTVTLTLRDGQHITGTLRECRTFPDLVTLRFVGRPVNINRDDITEVSFE